MSQRSKRDPKHIEQYEHDEASNAKRVKIADTEINMELNHADGDSVTSHPAKLSASALGVDASDDGKEIIPPLDCSSIRVLDVYIEGSGSIQVLASPVDSGNYFVEITAQSYTENLNARRIKIISNDARGNVHLVGRS